MKMPFHGLTRFNYYFAAVIYILICLAIVLGIIWLIKFLIECWRVNRLYRICKCTPNLHPVYSDVQFLSQQRKLYNLETHLIKYIIAIICSAVEILSFVWVMVTDLVRNELHRERMQKPDENRGCHNFYSNGYILTFNAQFFLFFIQFFLISFLTRYLAARYLVHPYKKILLKYLVWFGMQTLITISCSTDYTVIFSFVLFPIISLTNWAVLLRDSLLLSRVLKSHLREIRLFSSNTAHYRGQQAAVRFYSIFRTIILISYAFLVIFSIVTCTMEGVTFLFNSCQINSVYSYGFSLPSSVLNSSVESIKVFNSFAELIGELSIFIFSVTLTMPVLALTLAPTLHKCYQRFTDSEAKYRFNYENIKKPLLV